MSAPHQSPALTAARAHIEAWSNHDYDGARIIAGTGDGRNALIMLTVESSMRPSSQPAAAGNAPGLRPGY